jgi:hypothetical protein
MISFHSSLVTLCKKNNRMKITAAARLARAFSLMSIVVAITLDGSLVLANENDALITAAQKYVAAHSAVSGFNVSVEKIEGDYARVKVTPKNAGETDPAWVFLKRAKGIWRGLTMGTFFTPDDYAEFHIPPSVQQK